MRDQVDGIQFDMAKVYRYVTQLVLWVRILIMIILMVKLESIALWNVFATAQEIWDRVIDKGIAAVNSEKVDTVLRVRKRGRYSITPTGHPNGTAEV